MSAIIQACPDCPGVRYEGESCRMCAALLAARAEGFGAALQDMGRVLDDWSAPNGCVTEDYREGWRGSVEELARLVRHPQAFGILVFGLDDPPADWLGRSVPEPPEQLDLFADAAP